MCIIFSPDNIVSVNSKEKGVPLRIHPAYGWFGNACLQLADLFDHLVGAAADLQNVVAGRYAREVIQLYEVGAFHQLQAAGGDQSSIAVEDPQAGCFRIFPVDVQVEVAAERIGRNREAACLFQP